MKKQKEIRYVSYGLANSFYDRIELHEDLLLPQYSKLHGKLLAHELQHTDEPLSWKDLWLDMHINPGALGFMITRPNTWCDFSPVWRKDKCWIIDWNLIIFYGITLTMAGLFTIIARRYI